MDALRYITVKGGVVQVGDATRQISDVQARRTAIANAFRDLADEIESGRRTIAELQTFEQVRNGQPPVSVVHMVSTLSASPKPQENA